MPNRQIAFRDTAVLETRFALLSSFQTDPDGFLKTVRISKLSGWAGRSSSLPVTAFLERCCSIAPHVPRYRVQMRVAETC
jgi:hypothetical protein